MTALLQWNRLKIASDGDKEFSSEVSKNLPKLLKLDFPRLELDLGHSTNITMEGFQAVGTPLADAASKHQLIVRVTEEIAGFFEGSGLSDLMDVLVVEHMDGTIKASPDFDELAPDDDEIYPDDTGSENDSISNTKVQVQARMGQLIDEEDDKAYDIGQELVIGREAPATCVFQIPTISKRHFRLFVQGPAYFIEDLRSTNGTYLNGNPLTQPQPLGDGDEIVVAITLKHPNGARRFKFSQG
ncbi:FHA domain-containing protein [Planctomycetota bacterium]|nr:FHA domain-containing protein [Planctomycetota bacterium]